MALKEYHKKRNFKKTPEPKGKISKRPSKKRLYIIQKHAASHLHYDFRLELNGVLLSWAVPKGPSLDPSIKRLAMHVEDHPLEYGAFEGIIPKGQYGGGTVMLWDKGEWIPEGDPVNDYHKGSLSFTLKAKKLNGKWKLIRMHKNDKTWLLFKVKDEYAKSNRSYDITKMLPNSVLTEQSIDQIAERYKTIWGKKGAVKRKDKPIAKVLPQKKIIIPSHLSKSSFPDEINPQLATLVDKPPEGNQWFHEIKFDGYRILIFKQGKKIRLMTRNNNDWTSKFQFLVDESKMFPVSNVILDGELVYLDDQSHSNFQLLQNAIKLGKDILYYYAFDILYYDKYDLMDLPLKERKSILRALLESTKRKQILYSEHIEGSGDDIFVSACKLGLEGIVSKQMDSPYLQKRNKNWLKTKCILRQEFVVGGYLPSMKRACFRSLMLGTFDKQKKLQYHGNVGTGFTETSLREVYTLLNKYISPTMPYATRPPASKDAVWLKPKVVVEVEFTEWTRDNTLRHPSFKGVRLDKKAQNIIKEKPVSLKSPPHKSNNKKPKPSLSITNPSKILYPEDKITKADILNYYEFIQDLILPYVQERPLTLVRCPHSYQHCFYQKHISHQTLPGLHEIAIKEKKGVDDYLYINDLQGLLALTQLGVLEIHPWGTKISHIEEPDIIIFDLDPAPDVSWSKVVKAALRIKELLSQLKLQSFVKTTGGKGLHVLVPVKSEHQWDTIKTFSHTIVGFLVSEYPNEYIGTMSKKERKNKIFVDYLRNTRGATSVAPYSTRARLHAPISTPLAWDELTSNIKDTQFTIKTIRKRVDEWKEDPWRSFYKIKQSIKLK